MQTLKNEGAGVPKYLPKYSFALLLKFSGFQFPLLSLTPFPALCCGVLAKHASSQSFSHSAALPAAERAAEHTAQHSTTAREKPAADAGH